MRSQIATLRAAGKDPHVLVTQTNDGWFYGSSALDLHLDEHQVVVGCGSRVRLFDTRALGCDPNGPSLWASSAPPPMLPFDEAGAATDHLAESPEREALVVGG